MRQATKLIFAVLILLPLSALASGIQVSPARLKFAADGQAPPAQELVVANPTAEPLTFAVYAEDYPNAILAQPDNFALGPGGRRTILISINLGRLPGSLLTKLDVLSRPLNSNNLSVAAGVKIPLDIRLANLPPASRRWIVLRIGLVAALAAMFAAVWVFWRLKKQPR